MVILGLLLIVLAAGAIVSAVFTAEVHGGQVRVLGAFDLSPLTLFLIGVGAGLAIWFGLVFLRWGIRRNRARRKEEKRVGRQADEVEQVERKRDHTDDDLREAERDNRRSL